jgi:hypothetical protein
MKVLGVLFILSLPLAAQNTTTCVVPPPTVNGYTVTFPSTVTCTSSAPEAAAAAPVFSPQGGTYGAARTVSLTSATPGATIFYTTDTNAPMTGGGVTEYTGPISVTSTTTLKAIAIADGFSASQISTAAYTITAPPPVTAAIDCPNGFATSGACQADNDGGPGFAFINGGGGKSGLEGSFARIVALGDGHAAQGFNYQAAQVDVRAFTTIFTFVPDGQNVSFVLSNSSNNPTFNGKSFVSGAGCEAAFFQAFGQPAPNNVFALELDSYSPLDKANPFGPFVNSSVQIYHSGQSPCIPNDSGNNFPQKSKISTAPVALNSPANQQNTTTGHTYSATLTYDGTNLTLYLYDVTAGGSCPGSACFTHTWTSLDIPSLVGGPDAWVGFTGGTGIGAIAPLYVKSFVYSEVN